LAGISGGFTGRDEFLEGRAGTLQEPLTGLGQADAARRADEQRRAQASFQRAHRLAHGGRRHAEIGSGPAEVTVPGDSQEHLDAIQRTVPDCVVMLHWLF
jgi:hypothetical protein